MYQRQRQIILKVLQDGKIPDITWTPIGGSFPFRFMKSEHLIYVLPSVGYREKRVKREVIGRSAGSSVRVARGLSLRAGVSRGTPIERDELVNRGTGILAVTTKHIYFHGERAFRIPFSKIVSIEAYSDAVGITRDRASGLPEFFVVEPKDAEFLYSLLQAIPSVEYDPKEQQKQSMDEYYMLMYGESGIDYIEEEV